MFRTVLLGLGFILGASMVLPAAAESSATDHTADTSVEAARLTLQQLAGKHGDLRTFRAEYEQSRLTPLMKKPLVSTGTLFFRKKPGCLVFRSNGRKATVISIDEKRYQVYRPTRNKLEQFSVEKKEWTRAIFDTFAHRLDELEKHFDILGQEKAGTDSVRVNLKPKANGHEKTKKLLSLHLTVRVTDRVLTGVAYETSRRDRVTIRLDRVAIDAKIDAAKFEVEPKPGTQVIVHDK